MNDNGLGNSFDNDNSSNNTYRASTNLNMAIENPDVNINSIMGVNIQNIDTNNSQSNVNYNQSSNNLEQGFINNDVNNQVYNNSQSFINDNSSYQTTENVNNNTVDMNNNTNDQYQAQFIMGAGTNSNSNSNMNFVSEDNSSNIDNGDSNVRYEPTLKTKKKPGSGVEVAKEVKAMFVIVIILSLFIFGMPYIYDFFRNMN